MGRRWTSDAKRILVVLSSGPVLTASLASASPQRARREVPGRQCEVVSDAPPEVARQAADSIDRFCGALEKFYAPFGLEKRSDNKVKARLFAGYDDYVEFRDK